MSLRDIIYLDSGRLTSLLSQLHGRVAETGREADTDVATNNRMLRGGDKRLGSSVSTQAERVLEVRYFDHLLTDFLETLEANIVDLNLATLREQTDSAFERGTLVQASGPLFLDDYGSIAGQLSGSSKYFDIMELFSTADAKTTLEALTTMKPEGKDQRMKVEAAKAEKRAAIAAAAAQTKGLRETFTALGSAVDAFYGDAVECGVVLDGDEPALVRSLLDRSWLREPMPSLIQKYGTRSAARFTIIGTVTKASWITPPQLSQEERAAAESVRPGGASSGVTKIETNSVRGAVHAAQAVFEKVREMVTTIGVGDDVSIAPVVVFRNLDIGAPRP